MLTLVIETATPALIFTKLATLALRLMSAWRLSTSNSILPTESWGTLSKTSGAVDPDEPDVELSPEDGVVTLLLVEVVPDVVPVPGPEPDDVVGGVVRTDVVAALAFLGGEVAGGITPELADDCAKTVDVLRRKKLRKRANNAQRDAIAEK
jgi:hypothetical protein